MFSWIIYPIFYELYYIGYFLCISAFNEGNWEKIWNAQPDIVRTASPEGHNLPLRFIQGAVGEKFKSRILSNEIEFNAASLTTVVFKSL